MRKEISAGDMVIWHVIGAASKEVVSGPLPGSAKLRGVVAAVHDNGFADVREGGTKGPAWHLSTRNLTKIFEPDGFAAEVEAVCARIAAMLIEKNASYGDSVLNPMSVFSKLSADERIGVRMDDKLSRMARGHTFPGDNDLLDLVGYAVLKLVKSDRDARAAALPARFEPAQIPAAALAS